MRYFLLGIIFFTSCRQYTKPITDLDIQARILLASDSKFTITPKGSYVIHLGDRSVFTSGNLQFTYKQNKLYINSSPANTNSVRIEGTELFGYNNNIYRGSFTVHLDKKQIHLINNINIEEYLLSVVPAEIFPSWSEDALKSQAIAARTYALYEIRRNKNQFFDLYSDTRSQVYKGTKSENKNTTKAILETTGRVLTYDDDIIKSYFSASVGAKSASGIEIGDDQPYLQSRSLPMGDHPHTLWKYKISTKKFQQKLKLPHPIKKIAVTKRSPSGRIQIVTILDTKGKKTELKGDKVRQSLGYGIMKSTYARLDLTKPNEITIQGRGFGHGVGMGQWEAQELAKAGFDYQNILTRFYTDTKISSLYGISSIFHN